MASDCFLMVIQPTTGSLRVNWSLGSRSGSTRGEILLQIRALWSFALRSFHAAAKCGGMMCQLPSMARALGLYDLRFIAVTTPSPVSISSPPSFISALAPVMSFLRHGAGECPLVTRPLCGPTELESLHPVSAVPGYRHNHRRSRHRCPGRYLCQERLF